MLFFINPTAVFPTADAEERARAALIQARKRAIREEEEDFRYAPMELEYELAEDNALYTPCVVPQHESKEAEQSTIFASLVVASETAMEEDCMFALLEEEPIRVEDPDEVDVAYQQRVAQIVHELWLEEVAAYEKDRLPDGYEADIESFDFV